MKGVQTTLGVDAASTVPQTTIAPSFTGEPNTEATMTESTQTEASTTEAPVTAATKTEASTVEAITTEQPLQVGNAVARKLKYYLVDV